MQIKHHKAMGNAMKKKTRSFPTEGCHNDKTYFLDKPPWSDIHFRRLFLQLSCPYYSICGKGSLYRKFPFNDKYTYSLYRCLVDCFLFIKDCNCMKLLSILDRIIKFSK